MARQRDEEDAMDRDPFAGSDGGRDVGSDPERDCIAPATRADTDKAINAAIPRSF